VSVLKKGLKFLSASILLMAIAINSVFASVLGNEVEGGFYNFLGNGAYIYKNVFQSTQEGVGQQTEHFIEYAPNDEIVPVVTNGASIFGKRTIMEAYRYLVESGFTPIAGINADYFSFKTGVPMSNTIIDGELITKESEGQYGLGFNEDGSAFIGWMDITATLYTESQEIDIYNINKYRQPYTIYLMNDRFSDNTQNTTPGLDVILGNISGPLKLGGETTAVVENIVHSNGAIEIPEGKMVLTIDDNAFPELYEQVSNMKIGEKVTIKCNDIYSDQWNNAKYAIGCIGGKLVENGMVTGNFEAGAAPRTAVGIKPDGTVVFYTIDGRQQGYSYGVRMETLAMRMIELGCIEAVNLDGGGSTAIAGIYPGSTTMSVINSPSEGSPRRSANYIFLQKKSNKNVYHQYTDYISTEKIPVTVMPVKTEEPVKKPTTTPIPTEEPPMTESPTAEPTEQPVITEFPTATETPTDEPTLAPTLTPTETPLIIDLQEDDDYPKIELSYESNLITANIYSKSLRNAEMYIDGVKCQFAETDKDGMKTLQAYTTDDFDMKSHKIKVIAYNEDEKSNIGFYVTKGKYSYKNLFYDTVDSWALDNITYMADKGIIHGEIIDYKNYFKPQNEMTRAEFAVMITNSLGIDLSDYENVKLSFDDRSVIPKWASPHIAAMYARGIIMGKETKSGVIFDPNAKITRAEAMTIIARTLPERIRSQKLEFEDTDNVPSWAYESIGKLLSLNVISGYEDNTIRPDKKITKAEGIKLLFEIY